MAKQTEFGSYVSESNIYNTQELLNSDANVDDVKEFVTELQRRINEIAIVLNTKTTGYFVETEFVNGNLYFPNPLLTSFTGKLPIYRNEFRKVIQFGTLPNTGTTSVAHNIDFTGTYSFVRIYATATDPIGLTSIPIPYASPVLANAIEIDIDSLNINITTGSNRTAYTTCLVILAYVKE